MKTKNIFVKKYNFFKNRKIKNTAHAVFLYALIKAGLPSRTLLQGAFREKPLENPQKLNCK